MNRRLRLPPPKHRLAARSGSQMWPIALPSGEKMRTPLVSSVWPQPHHKLPSTSTRKPSGVPAPASMNTRLLASLVPLSVTSNTRIVRLGGSAWTT